MTKEEKQLLLKDLCARLPYGVLVKSNTGTVSPLMSRTSLSLTIIEIIELIKHCINKYDIRPYLRPMSSMTEEERKEYELLANRCIVTSIGFIHLEATALIDYLNENHFDYRGLIDKGIAIKVTEENNPYKQ